MGNGLLQTTIGISILMYFESSEIPWGIELFGYTYVLGFSTTLFSTDVETHFLCLKEPLEP